MKIRIEYLGMAMVTCFYLQKDTKKIQRYTILAKLLRNGSYTDSILLEALMACLDVALTDEWKPYVALLKGRYVVAYDSCLEDPSESVFALFQWLQTCWNSALTSTLKEDCLKVEGMYMICA